MSDQSERPVPKFKPETPERVQITVDVSPEVKRRLEWVAEQTGWSITRLLEQSAQNKTRLVLADLKPGDREAYLAGALDEFPGKRIRRMKIELPDEVAVVSAKITVEARRQLELYSRLTRMPLGAIVDQLATGMVAAPRRRPCRRSQPCFRSATRSSPAQRAWSFPWNRARTPHECGHAQPPQIDRQRSARVAVDPAGKCL